MAYHSGKIGSVKSDAEVTSTTTTSSTGTTTHTARTKFVNQFELEGVAYRFETRLPAPLQAGHQVKFRSGAFGKGVRELCDHDNGYYHGPAAWPVFVLALLFSALLAAVYLFRWPFPGDVVAAPFERLFPQAVPYVPWAFVLVALLLWLQGFRLAGLKKKVCTL